MSITLEPARIPTLFFCTIELVTRSTTAFGLMFPGKSGKRHEQDVLMQSHRMFIGCIELERHLEHLYTSRRWTPPPKHHASNTKITLFFLSNQIFHPAGRLCAEAKAGKACDWLNPHRTKPTTPLDSSTVFGLPSATLTGSSRPQR